MVKSLLVIVRIEDEMFIEFIVFSFVYRWGWERIGSIGFLVCFGSCVSCLIVVFSKIL